MNKDDKIGLLERMFVEKEQTEGYLRDLEQDIDKLWVSICYEFYDESVDFKARVLSLERYIAEHKPGLLEKMKQYLINKNNINNYLKTVMEEKEKQ